MTTVVDSQRALGRSRHVMVVSWNEEMVAVAQEGGESVDPLDPHYWVSDVRWEYDPGDGNRPCRVVSLCDCFLTDEQRDELDRVGDGPCPEAPSGSHALYGSSPGYAAEGCWAQVWESTLEVLRELALDHGLGPGEYQVYLRPPPYSDTSIMFELAEFVAELSGRAEAAESRDVS